MHNKGPVVKISRLQNNDSCTEGYRLKTQFSKLYCLWKIIKGNGKSLRYEISTEKMDKTHRYWLLAYQLSSDQHHQHPASSSTTATTITTTTTKSILLFLSEKAKISPVPHVERVPCRFDDALFPGNQAYKVQLSHDRQMWYLIYQLEIINLWLWKPSKKGIRISSWTQDENLVSMWMQQL